MNLREDSLTMPDEPERFEAQLNDLEEAAGKLGIDIEYADLSDPEIPMKSGHCRLNGNDLILVDRNLPSELKIKVFLNALKTFDLETIYIASWIRDRIESQETEKMEQ